MIFPQAMTEIELIVPARDLLAVTQVLSSEGTFQQADSSTLGLNNDAGGKKKDGTWNERAAAYASLERRILTTMQALGIDEEYPPKADFEGLVDLETIHYAAYLNILLIRRKYKPIIEECRITQYGRGFCA